MFGRWTKIGLLLLSLSLVGLTTACQSDAKKNGGDDGRPEPHPTIITSEPKGAVVSINEQPIGTTPCKVTLPDKKRLFIRLAKEGCFTISEELVQSVEGWPTSLTYPMRRKVR